MHLWQRPTQIQVHHLLRDSSKIITNMVYCNGCLAASQKCTGTGENPVRSQRFGNQSSFPLSGMFGPPNPIFFCLFPEIKRCPLSKSQCKQKQPAKMKAQRHNQREGDEGGVYRPPAPWATAAPTIAPVDMLPSSMNGVYTTWHVGALPDAK